MGKIAASDVFSIVMGGTQDAGGGALMRCFGEGADQCEECLGQPGFTAESGGDQRAGVYGARGEALAAIALLEFQRHQGIAQLGLAIGIEGGYAVLFFGHKQVVEIQPQGVPVRFTGDHDDTRGWRFEDGVEQPFGQHEMAQVADGRGSLDSLIG